MNNEEVHIIKIGEINVEPFHYIMVDEDTDIRKYYVDILRDHLHNNLRDDQLKIWLQHKFNGDRHTIRLDRDVKIMKTSGIIRQPTLSRYNTFIGISQEPLIGIPDDVPIVGSKFTINNFSWGTSIVNYNIDNIIIITKNSVYAIHNKSHFRDTQLKLIGI